MKDIHFAHLSSLEIHLKKHTWKIYISIRDVIQMQYMNATHLVCHFKFKEMVLQRSTNSSLLIWRQPTHQIPNMDENPNILL